MLKLISFIAVLACVGPLQMGCACRVNQVSSTPTPNYPPAPESIRPELDDNVKIQLGHWKTGPHLSMGAGLVFMWYDRRVISEEEFCFLVAKAYETPSL